jgi:hypothetical protein
MQVAGWLAKCRGEWYLPARPPGFLVLSYP